MIGVAIVFFLLLYGFDSIIADRTFWDEVVNRINSIVEAKYDVNKKFPKGTLYRKSDYYATSSEIAVDEQQNSSTKDVEHDSLDNIEPPINKVEENEENRPEHQPSTESHPSETIDMKEYNAEKIDMERYYLSQYFGQLVDRIIDSLYIPPKPKKPLF